MINEIQLIFYEKNINMSFATKKRSNSVDNLCADRAKENQSICADSPFSSHPVASLLSPPSAILSTFNYDPHCSVPASHPVTIFHVNKQEWARFSALGRHFPVKRFPEQVFGQLL